MGNRRPRRASARYPYRILVAEDDEAFLDTLEAVLHAHDELAVVGRARNGQEAVEMAEELEPDLVLMDIEMPVLDGVEATRLLHERMPDLPVLAISGHAGAVDYIRKARLEDELPQVAVALVRGQRSRR